MIELSNLRLEKHGEWTRLICDISGLKEVEPKYSEDTMWVALQNENVDMFATNVYDAFVLIPFYLGMYYGLDVKIHGNMSKQLYHNLTNYVWKILMNHCDTMQHIGLYVDGFDTVEQKSNIIGTGITCGIDSLSVFYSRWKEENDSDYKLNTAFLFNHGSHGDFDDENTRKLFLTRNDRNKQAAKEMNLPIVLLDSNIHAFSHVHNWGVRIGGFALFSCAISLQKVVRKYYIASDLSYSQILKHADISRDYSLQEYADSYLIPLIRTENMELIFEGGQYKRTEKTELIADWHVANKYLNVCTRPDEKGGNCSHCVKCMRTLMPLDAINKMSNFSSVFDLDVYRKYLFYYKCHYVVKYGKDAFCTDIVDFCKENGMKFPIKIVAWGYYLIKGGFSLELKKAMRKLLGDKNYEKLKVFIRRT